MTYNSKNQNPVIYDVIQNSPQLFQRAVLPGACTGVTWGVAFFCWLYANEILGEHVTFPILATAPRKSF